METYSSRSLELEDEGLVGVGSSTDMSLEARGKAEGRNAFTERGDCRTLGEPKEAEAENALEAKGDTPAPMGLAIGDPMTPLAPPNEGKPVLTPGPPTAKALL